MQENVLTEKSDIAVPIFMILNAILLTAAAIYDFEPFSSFVVLLAALNLLAFVLVRIIICGYYDKIFKAKILTNEALDMVALRSLLASKTIYRVRLAMRYKMFRTIIYSRCLLFPRYSSKLPYKLWFDGFNFRKNSSFCVKAVLIFQFVAFLALLVTALYAMLAFQ